jgi:hypothetical protein
MHEPSPSNASRSNGFAILTAATVLLAPILSFSVQPITGKYLLPLLGGTATTWLSSLIFFQFCVLAGYLAAFGIVRLGGRSQAIIVGLAAVLSFALVRMPPIIDPATLGISSLILGLMGSLLLPVTFLFMIGVVLHEWLGIARGSIPWYLYALSNLGSIFALLIYPFLIEPQVDLTVQSLAWRLLLLTLVTLVIVLCVFRWRLPSANFRKATVNEEPLPRMRPLAWLGLSFLSCLLFMGSTRELTAELGSHPLAWVLPLALYLGSFSITFAGFWGKRLNLAAGILFVIVMTAYASQQGLEIAGLNARSIQFLLLSTGLGCVFLNGTLYHLRSQHSFATFYIMLALGGCLAGIFSTLLAPLIFNRNYELYLAALITAALVAYFPTYTRRFMRPAFVLAAILPTTWILYQDVRNLRSEDPAYGHHFLRTIYSQNILTVSLARLIVSSEATRHGSEITQSELKGVPTTYYHMESPIGMVFEYLEQQNDPTPRHIGVIGLGAGTLAYYGRSQDKMVFWDIDPVMLQIAQSFFSYLSNSPAQIELRLADGRLGVRDLESPLSMLVVDAFTGDAVPTHLLTEDAFSEFAHATNGGWLVFHISSRWLDVTPVLQANLESSGRRGVHIITLIEEEESKVTDYCSASYVIIPPKNEVNDFLDFLRPKIESNPYVKSMLKVPSDLRSSIPWTDDRHSITQLLNWSKLF